MSEALRDRNKVPSLLAADRDLKETIPLRASRDGALLVALSEGDAEDLEGTAKLKEAIKLDLNVSRDKELFDKSFREITVPVIEGEFTLYIDEPEENKGLTINRALSIETKAEKFYVSNGSGKGRAEIWLWE